MCVCVWLLFRPGAIYPLGEEEEEEEERQRKTEPPQRANQTHPHQRCRRQHRTMQPGWGVEFPPATPTSSRGVGPGDVTGGAGPSSSVKKGALELALQSPTLVTTDSQTPQVYMLCIQ